MKWKYLIILAVAVWIYLFIGGAAFHYLETVEIKQSDKDAFNNMTKEFLDAHPCISQVELEMMVQSYMEAYGNGVIEIANSSSLADWSWTGSVFFGLTVITTIGYGKKAPATTGGQAFTVIFAIIGIPFCLGFLAEIGHKQRKLFKAVDKCFSCCDGSKVLGALQLILMICLGLILFVFVPAIIFMYVQDWTYGEALYYCLITMTTIGFGDYVPGIDKGESAAVRGVYRIGVAFWVFIGLAWLAGVLSYLQELYMEGMQKTHQAIKKRKSSHKVEHKDGVESGISDLDTKHNDTDLPANNNYNSDEAFVTDDKSNDNTTF